MKKSIPWILSVVVLLSIGLVLDACNDASAINVVKGTKPVDTHDYEWRTNFVAGLKSLTPEQRRARIDSFLPHLNTALTDNLRRAKFMCAFTSITYRFGSGKADSVASGDGKKYSGYYEDELYAIVKGPCIKDSITAFVACYNGTFYLKADQSDETIGTYGSVFTIEKNRGINYYTDYLTAIYLAEKHHLVLTEGRGSSIKIITPARARELYGKIDQVLVRVLVNEGDQFDLPNGTFTPANN